MNPVDRVGRLLEQAGVITVERFRSTVVLAWGRTGRSYRGVLGMQPSPVAISAGRPWVHPELLG